MPNKVSWIQRTSPPITTSTIIYLFVQSQFLRFQATKNQQHIILNKFPWKSRISEAKKTSRDPIKTTENQPYLRKKTNAIHLNSAKETQQRIGELGFLFFCTSWVSLNWRVKIEIQKQQTGRALIAVGVQTVCTLALAFAVYIRTELLIRSKKMEKNYKFMENKIGEKSNYLKNEK